MRIDRKVDRKTHGAEPIKYRYDIERLRSNLFNKPRDLLLFDLATQTGISMTMLLRLKVKSLSGIKEGQTIFIESDKGQKHLITINEVIYKTFQKYIKEIGPRPNDYLFKSKKGHKPLNLSSVSNMIKGWFNAAGIINCYGALSLRKTWEYNQEKNITTTSKADYFLKPIDTTTTQSKVYKQLFKAIISRKFPPGYKLNINEISKELNISQAPVRVAVNRLEARGFVVSRKKTGSFVKELSLKELKEILKARLVLESTAAELAYKVCSEETLSLLESIIESYEKATSFEDRDHLNTKFHITLYKDADIPIFTSIIYHLCNMLSPYVILQDKKSDYHTDFKELTCSYREILEGFRNKDLDLILKALKSRLVKAEQNLTEFLRD